MISTHIFMFPFRWDYKSSDDDEDISLFDCSFENRVSKQIKTLKTILEANNWQYKPFIIQQESDYNEYIYFYDYVREAIYNKNEKLDNNQTIYHFEYKCIDKNSTYSIKIKPDKKEIKEEKNYNLQIENITLKLYDTGVGVITFFLANNKYETKEDILLINDYGRRVYPQFLAGGIDTTKEAFLADTISLSIKEEAFDDFTKFDYRDNPTKIAKFIMVLLGDKFKDNINKPKKNEVLISPIIDDRMFTICWYGNDEISNKLKNFNEDKEEYPYLTNKYWYSYLFVDKDKPTCENRVMFKELLKKHSYDRWIEDGTIYGMCRYSFVSLSSTNKSYFSYHVKSMYYQIVLSTLIQRASILRFSDEVNHISALKDNDKEVLNRVESLHKNYIKFINRIYFREVTAQEQGIELYDKMLEVMKIKENVKDLDSEISELYNYARLIEDRQTKSEVDKITKIGGVLLPPTLVAGFFGMNTIPKSISENGIWLIISFAIIVYSAIYGYEFAFKDKGKK